MRKTGTMSQIRSGFRIAGAWLLGFGWLFLVFSGLAVAFSPGEGKYPPVVGWVLLVFAAVILVATAQRWVKALPGILGVATLNGVLEVSSGHAINSPSVPISRFEAVVATLLLAASTTISLSFTRRNLNMVDRIAFLAYASCIAWAGVANRVILPAGTAACCLFFAWAYDRFRRPRNHGQTSKLRDSAGPFRKRNGAVKGDFS